MIVVIMVLETTTAPQLNIILQSSKRCEVAVGVGQRAADLRIVFQIPAHKRNCVKARLAKSKDRCKRVFAHNNNAGRTGK
jgi:hypothetical protein